MPWLPTICASRRRSPRARLWASASSKVAAASRSFPVSRSRVPIAERRAASPGRSWSSRYALSELSPNPLASSRLPATLWEAHATCVARARCRRLRSGIWVTAVESSMARANGPVARRIAAAADRVETAVLPSPLLTALVQAATRFESSALSRAKAAWPPGRSSAETSSSEPRAA